MGLFYLQHLPNPMSVSPQVGHTFEFLLPLNISVQQLSLMSMSYFTRLACLLSFASLFYLLSGIKSNAQYDANTIMSKQGIIGQQRIETLLLLTIFDIIYMCSFCILEQEHLIQAQRKNWGYELILKGASQYSHLQYLGRKPKNLPRLFARFN